MRKKLGFLIFEARWILYPVNVGLILALILYVISFLTNDYIFLRYNFTWDMESLMVTLLGFVDASMVANLIIMVVQGGHQIFIHKFELSREDCPQYLDHIDSGILKVKIALSIAGITLVQILKDFVNIEKVDWVLCYHRMVIHGMALVSALVMAVIWRVTHPKEEHEVHPIEPQQIPHGGFQEAASTLLGEIGSQGVHKEEKKEEKK